MKIVRLAAGIAAMLGASVATAAPKLTGEARVAQIVAGRTAGAPVTCILLREIQRTELIRDVGVVYYLRDGRILVNRPGNGPFINGFDDIMVTDTQTPQLCRLDLVRLIDRTSQVARGAFSLGDFVPYTKPRKS